MGKTVLTKEEAERVAIAYNPRKFPATISPTAVEFHAFNSGLETSGFRIDKIVAQQTGVAELERLSIEEKVEREALVRLKELQEQAYQQAYQLGLDEGREKAFEERRAELDEKLQHMENLLSTIERLKEDLVASNEAQILRLVYALAKKVVLDEVAQRPELVLQVMKEAVESAQEEDNVVVRVSPSDHQFFEGIREKLGKDFDSVKRAKLEASEEIASGGCIVETEYGSVSATLDQRLEKLWTAIAEKLPKIKNIVGG